MQSYARKHIAEASYHIMLSCLAQAYSNIGCIYQREGMDGEAGLYLKRALA
ncbi:MULTISPECIES: hypothetical protein [Bacteroides]|jgi:hypothetical protein|uniref:hypothetical protein n=1 Tax=Bacteroides TaxID=816 RepID=UPI0013146515|nr:MULTISPECIES: hypothetical protein [Bacteroides]MBS7573290.1 hypothetical protein [Bacteroides propionicigenes]